nr:immunoglobulin light chain junction region [Macaca mulatta]
CQQYDGTPYSF